MTKNIAVKKKKNVGILSETTASDVADLIEYAINENEPKLKTSRGMGSTVEIKVGGRKWTITVAKKARAKKAKA